MPPPPGSVPPLGWSVPPPGGRPATGATLGDLNAPTGGITGRVLPLRPLAVNDMLDGAFTLLRACFAIVALVILVVQAPYQLLTSLTLAQYLPELGDPLLFDTLDEALAFDLLGRAVGWGLLVTVLGLLVGVIVNAAVVATALEVDRGATPTVGSVLRASLSRAGATIGASLLAALATMVGFVAVLAVLLPFALVVAPLAVVLAVPLLLVLALLATALGSLVIPVAMVEGRGAWQTFTRALWVLRRRFGRVLGMTVLAGLVVLLVTFAISFALSAVGLLAGPLAWVVDGLNGVLVSIVSTPITAFVALLVYLDARVRLEGLDLRLRAQGLGPA